MSRSSWCSRLKQKTQVETTMYFKFADTVIAAGLPPFIQGCTTYIMRIMTVFWPNKITNSRLLQMAKQDPMGTILKHRQWKWFGHTLCMDVWWACTNYTDLGFRGNKEEGPRPCITWRRTTLKELPVDVQYHSKVSYHRLTRRVSFLTSALEVPILR